MKCKKGDAPSARNPKKQVEYSKQNHNSNNSSGCLPEDGAISEDGVISKDGATSEDGAISKDGATPNSSKNTELQIDDALKLINDTG